jgi:hypothetical protein
MSGSDLCSPRNETVRPRYFQNRIIMFCLPISMHIHVSVSDLHIRTYSQDRSAFFAAAKKAFQNVLFASAYAE